MSGLSGEERLQRALEGMRMLPETPAVTYRGVSQAAGTAPGALVTAGITATSRDLVVATAGMTSPGLAVVIGSTGRDLAAFSAVQEAQEVVYLPGTLLFMGRFVQAGGYQVEVIQEVTRDQAGQMGAPAVDLDALARSLGQEVIKAYGRQCPVPVDYCERFAEQIF